MDDFVLVDIPSWWDQLWDYAWSGLASVETLFLMLSDIYQ